MAVGISLFDQEVVAFDPAQLPQPAAEGLDIRMWRDREPADARALGLRPCYDRPRHRRAAEQRDEFAALHSITSSASNCIELGTSMPSALAVCRLITNSNLLDCTTGKSAGFSPLRIRPT